jgi:hypothetical protein
MAETTAKIVLTAEDRTAAALANLRNGLSGVEARASSLRGVFGSLVPAISFAGLVAGVKSINDGVDALNDLKDATGASIENISALEDVAARTGTSFDTVGTSLVKFNQLLNEAKPDSDAAAALKAIGLEAAALKQLDPAEALRVTAVALGQFADDGNKARVVQELFGKSLREVAPFLNDLKEQGSLVAKVAAQQAEEAERLNKQLFELQKNAKDAGRSIVAGLVPEINRLVTEFKLGIEASEGFFDALYTYGFKYGPGKSPAENIRDINKEIERLRAVTDGGGLNSLVNGERAEADIKRLERQLNYFKQLQRLQVDISASNQSDAESRRLGLPGGQSSVGSLPDKAKKTGAEQIDEQRTSLAAYVRQQQQQLDATEQLTETQKALNFLQSQGVQGQIPQVRELVLGLAERADKEKKITEVLREQNRLQKEMDDAYQSRLKGMLESGPAARLEKTRQDMLMLAAEFEAGNITKEQFEDAATGMLNLSKATGEASKSANEFGFIFSSAFEDAIVSGKDLSEVIQGLTQDIARMVLRKAVTEPIGKKVAGFFDGFDIASIFGFANGGIMTPAGPLPLHSYASGGIASSPQLALFGEGRMNEAFVPLPDGRSIPVSLRRGAGDQPVVQNFNFNGPADRSTVITAARLGAAMAREERHQDKARGRA